MYIFLAGVLHLILMYASIATPNFRIFMLAILLLAIQTDVSKDLSTKLDLWVGETDVENSTFCYSTSFSDIRVITFMFPLST